MNYSLKHIFGAACSCKNIIWMICLKKSQIRFLVCLLSPCVRWHRELSTTQRRSWKLKFIKATTTFKQLKLIDKWVIKPFPHRPDINITEQTKAESKPTSRHFHKPDSRPHGYEVVQHRTQYSVFLPFCSSSKCVGYCGVTIIINKYLIYCSYWRTLSICLLTVLPCWAKGLMELMLVF